MIQLLLEHNSPEAKSFFPQLEKIRACAGVIVDVLAFKKVQRNKRIAEALPQSRNDCRAGQGITTAKLRRALRG
jgi:hemerythrin superfamily protein